MFFYLSDDALIIMCGWWVYACCKRSHVGKSFVDAAIGCDLTYHSFLTYMCAYLGFIVCVALITVCQVQVSMYSDYTQPMLLTYYVSITSHFSQKACHSGGCTWRGGEDRVPNGLKSEAESNLSEKSALFYRCS